jgi:HD-like signal output (HDOD) protein
MPATAPSRDTILRLAQKLPTTPAVLGKLQRLLANTNSELEDVCSLLKRDLSLSVRILRISNSPYYGSTTPHASLEEAVGCVGFNEIYKVVGLSVSSQLFNCDLGSYGYPADLLWENILCTALAMESLAQFAGINPRSAYTSALMRSIGKIVLDRLAAESCEPERRLPADEATPLCDWETRVFGCDNAAVAALLLTEWNLCEDSVTAIIRHYHPEAEPEAELPAFILNLAGRISSDLGYGLPGEEAYWGSIESKLAHAQIDEGEFSLCTAETKMAFENIRRVFSDSAELAAAD